jgi:hypothetical protein
MSIPEQVADPDDLVTLTTKPTEFEANLAVVVLAEAGIKAFAFAESASILELGRTITPVPIQVRRADLERAREALKQSVADSVDLDWDSVDVGEREDNLPLTVRSGMPLAAKVGFALAAAVLVLGLLWGLWGILAWP